ncbi:MAG: LptA/OstA family protein [bacterium]
MNIKNLFFVFCFLILSFCLIKAEEKKEEKIYLSADNAEYYYDEKAELTTFLQGNVFCKSGETEFYADEAKVYKKGETVFLQKNIKIIDKKRNFTLFGNEAFYEKTKKYIKVIGPSKLISDDMEVKGEIIEIFGEEKIAKIQGIVDFTKKEIKAQASSAIYYDVDRKIEFIDNAKIWKEKELEIIGKKITYYLDNKKLIIEGEVKANIIPKQEEKK